MLGAPISALDAERFGLVNRVVGEREFPKVLDETVEQFLALPPASAAASKWLTARAFDLPFDEFRREMEAGLATCLSSPEHQTAMEEIRARVRFRAADTGERT